MARFQFIVFRIAILPAFGRRRLHGGDGFRGGSENTLVGANSGQDFLPVLRSNASGPTKGTVDGDNWCEVSSRVNWRKMAEYPVFRKFEVRTSKSICSLAGFVLSALPTFQNPSGETPMARITLRQLLDHAAEQDYGVPAFNINNMEQALAIMAAADKTDSPVILQASRGARSYANDIMLKHMMDAVTEIYPHIPVCVHLDHGNESGTCMTAIQSGFTSVMMDGSLKADGKTPADWDYNVGITKQSPRWPIWAAFRLKVNSVFWVRSKPAKAKRKMATALKASSATTSC